MKFVLLDVCLLRNKTGRIYMGYTALRCRKNLLEIDLADAHDMKGRYNSIADNPRLY